MKTSSEQQIHGDFIVTWNGDSIAIPSGKKYALQSGKQPFYS